METILRVEDLEKEGILDRISFEMARGEMLAVMGPSGSGKSTLLYNTAGLDQPTGGRVWLRDTLVTGLSEDEKAKLRLHRMGFVFQQMNMMPRLTILDNILLPAIQANRRRGRDRRTKAELMRTVIGLMQKLSISGLEERSITQVSGGQLQRACICRSMMNAPEILFADEPTGALNRSAAKEVMRELIRVNREGTAVLLVTHDSGVASQCDRILYLLDGRIRGELTMEQDEKAQASALTDKQREDKVNDWLSGLGW